MITNEMVREAIGIFNELSTACKELGVENSIMRFEKLMKIQQTATAEILNEDEVIAGASGDVSDRVKGVITGFHVGIITARLEREQLEVES